LIECCQIGREELLLEGGERPHEDERHDEQIADHSGEVAPEVPLEDRQDNMTAHRRETSKKISSV
jgi:hypothetical protein